MTMSTGTATTTATADIIMNTDSAALMRLGALLHLVDPTLPIGGFNHSGGLETFVQQITNPQQQILANTALYEFLRTAILFVTELIRKKTDRLFRVAVYRRVRNHYAVGLNRVA